MNQYDSVIRRKVLKEAWYLGEKYYGERIYGAQEETISDLPDST